MYLLYIFEKPCILSFDVEKLKIRAKEELDENNIDYHTLEWNELNPLTGWYGNALYGDDSLMYLGHDKKMHYPVRETIYIMRMEVI